MKMNPYDRFWNDVGYLQRKIETLRKGVRDAQRLDSDNTRARRNYLERCGLDRATVRKLVRRYRGSTVMEDMKQQVDLLCSQIEHTLQVRFSSYA